MNKCIPYFITVGLFVCSFVCLGLWNINLCMLFNAKSSFRQIVLFQTIRFNITVKFNCLKHFYFKLFSLVKLLIQAVQFSISIGFVKTDLFQTIQFSVGTVSISKTVLF